LFNKLCRTRIIEQLEQMGSKIERKYLDDNAFDAELRKKLEEEKS
jgi:predicted house-cleaning noncanonical NTP pyrophosphatase (MazG superfamily)